MTHAEEMLPVLRRWKKSGLSLLGLAKSEELSYSKLQYWAAKLGGSKKTGEKSQSVELTRVHVVPDESLAEPRKPEVLSVWLPNGVALEVPTGFDEVELRRLVGILSTC